MTDSYYTIESPAVSEVKILKSRFIANAFCVESQTEASEKIEFVKKKFFDAAHHPFAYRLGADKNNFKTSDDGEPSGTGGKPVLQAIDKFELTNVIVIVARYFGGTKLGTGGLRRAFFEAADDCLSQSKVVQKFLFEKFQIEFDYVYLSAVMKLIELSNVNLISNDSTDRCRLIIEIRVSESKNVIEKLINATNGNLIYELIR